MPRPAPQPRPQRQPRQWSADPNAAAQPAPQRAPAPQGQQRPGRPQQRPRPQQSGKLELQPIEQEVSEFTATGERLENLPPQQAPTDKNFNTDLYVHNLKRQIKEDQSISQANRQKEDILKGAEKIETQPMKFDGKEMRGAKVNVVKAPNTSNQKMVPIVVIAILVVALIGIAIYVFSSGILKPKTAAITFEKPASWSDTVYVYIEQEGKKNADKPGEAMTKGTGNTYTYNVREDLTKGKIIFSDGTSGTGHNYGEKESLTVSDGKTYSVPSEASQSSSKTSGQTSVTSKASN